MCELCDNAFSQGTFIHEWRYNIKRPTPAPEMAVEKTWAPAQSYQMTILKHHFPKEVYFTVCTNRCYWYCYKKKWWYRRCAHYKLSFLRQNMLHMQHHFLCNISYLVIAASMENSLKYTTSLCCASEHRHTLVHAVWYAQVPAHLCHIWCDRKQRKMAKRIYQMTMLHTVEILHLRQHSHELETEGFPHRLWLQFQYRYPS